MVVVYSQPGERDNEKDLDVKRIENKVEPVYEQEQQLEDQIVPLEDPIYENECIHNDYNDELVYIESNVINTERTETDNVEEEQLEELDNIDDISTGKKIECETKVDEVDTELRYNLQGNKRDYGFRLANKMNSSSMKKSYDVQFAQIHTVTELDDNIPTIHG